MLILTSEGRRYPGRTDPTTLQFRFTTARSFLFLFLSFYDSSLQELSLHGAFLFIRN